MAEANKKPNVFARIARWFREMRSELKKVVWPDGKKVLKNTLTVIACAIAVAIVIWVFDLVAGLAYNGILQLADLLKG
jgi:preprotein translocase subunit SecE